MPTSKFPAVIEAVPVDWQALLVAVRSGQRAALAPYWDQVISFLMSHVERELTQKLRSKLDPDDIVQQSMLEVQLDVSKFQGQTEAELRAWLIQVLKHNLLDATRQFRHAQSRDVSREVSLERGDRSIELPARDLTASKIVSHQEQDQLLLNAITRLPDRRRQVIELRHGGGMGYAEIAVKLRITQAAARQLWVRAIEQLQADLVKKPSNRPQPAWRPDKPR